MLWKAACSCFEKNPSIRKPNLSSLVSLLINTERDGDVLMLSAIKAQEESDLESSLCLHGHKP